MTHCNPYAALPRALGAMLVTLGLAACASQAPKGADDALLRGEIDRGVQEVAQARPPRAQRPAPSFSFIDRGTGARVQVLSFAQIQGWSADDHPAAFDSFQVSCRRILGLRSASILGGVSNRLNEWKAVCAQAATLSPAQARQFFETRFTPIQVEPAKQALLTAYYEPELPASRTPTARFRFPIYRKPPELIREGSRWGRRVNGRLQPYFTRGDIYNGALNGRGLEIAYLDDATELLFLQIQGSGKLRFPDGSTRRVSYAGKSGQDFRSVGLEMKRRGLSRSGSKADIKQYVRANPAAGLDLLAHNQSYVFFSEASSLDPRRGPIGALGVQLTDLRSIAVDRRFVPLGAPVWVEGQTSIGYIRRLMVAQDTGSAVKGAQRADIFWGSGDAAGAAAGRTKGPGKLTVLVPNATITRWTTAGVS